MPSRIRTAYDRRLAEGRLTPDPSQIAVVEALTRLEKDLGRRGLFGGRPAVRGVYLCGPPGRGKSLLMDMFFATVPEPRKTRAHFHAFMARVHDLVRQWREGNAKARKAVFGQSKGDDPIRPVAELIASEARLLCFDELQVTDIADAMILGRLFEALFERGVVLMVTSNRAPDQLYLNGINRQLFLPFIALLKSRVEVVSVAGPHDYRLDRLRAAGTWFSPIDPDNRRTFDALWRDMLGPEAAEGESIEVMGRKLEFPAAAGGLVRTAFTRLCDAALGPNDYLALAERFHTVFLEDLPRLSPSRREAARRFVTLVDTLYEARTRLIVLAEADPARLYPSGDGAFEFERTASRLQEMRSADWLADRS
jgi:cell division protein ZapE